MVHFCGAVSEEAQEAVVDATITALELKEWQDAGKDIFLNLAAPLLINATTRRGLQVVSDDPRYTTRAAIPQLKPEAKETESGTAERAPLPKSASTAP